MKKWICVIFLAILVLSACVPVSDQGVEATMPLPGSELTKAAFVGETPGVEGTASPTAPPTSTNTATQGPTSTATILPTLTSPPTDLPTLLPPETATETAPPAVLSETPGDQGGAGETVVDVDDDLTFTTSDGTELRASFYKLADEPGPFPGVMILPMHIESREVWGPYAQQLAAAGFAVLTIDLQSQEGSAAARDWVKFAGDVHTVLGTFAAREDVDDGRIGILGSSLGANMALAVAAVEPSVKCVVLISPVLEYSGLNAVEAIGAYGTRPVMLVASSNDRLAGDAVGTLEALAQGEVVLKGYEGTEHGTILLLTEPTAAEAIKRFLEDKVKEGATAPPAGTPGFSLAPLFFAALVGALGILLLGAGGYMIVNRIGPPAEVTDLLSLDKIKHDQGFVQLEGQIDEVPEPLDKDAEHPLVFLRLLIEEFDPEEGWKVRYDGMTSTSFWLLEEHGKIWVQADELDKRYLGEGFHASTRQAEQALVVLGQSKKAAWGKGLRYKMWELRLGQKISVSGQVRRRLELIPSMGQPLTVVPLPEAGRAQAVPVAAGWSRASTIVALLILGFVLICGGGTGIVVTILSWMR